MTTTCAVDVHGLTKRYGRRTVVADLDLQIHAGAVTGLVGPNGAGKTTVMAMLLGLVRPTAGRGTVLGQPVGRPERYLARVGALIEGPAFFPGLSAVENLTYFARLGRHTFDADGLLRLVGLDGRGGDPVGSYSLGMKQRLGIAASLLPDPELVVLDEPSNGVDPVGMRDLRAIIRTIADQGRTVLVSSHLLGELEQVCDDVAVLDRGGLAYQGPLHDLPRSRHEAVRLVPLDADQTTRLREVAAREARIVDVSGSAVVVAVDGGDAARLAATLNTRALSADVPLSEVSLRHSDLESRYLSLVQQEEAA